MLLLFLEFSCHGYRDLCIHLCYFAHEGALSPIESNLSGLTKKGRHNDSIAHFQRESFPFFPSFCFLVFVLNYCVCQLFCNAKIFLFLFCFLKKHSKKVLKQVV